MRARPPGLALPEALIGIFLLVTAMVLSTTLFHAAMTYSLRGEGQALAVAIAEEQLARLRS